MGDQRIEQVTVMKSARVGYALDIDTPIPTPSGWTTMGDVSEGDTLFDESGRPCAVILKSPVYTDHQCYEVKFCDGSSIIADAGHRWFVEADVCFETLLGDRGKGITGRPKPGQASTRSGVLSTEQMAKCLLRSRGRSALAVPNQKALDLPEADLPIPPYTLGLWLGDGNSNSARITQHRSDVETAQYIEAEGICASVRYIDNRHANNATIFLDVPDEGKPVSRWTTKLRKAGLLNNKHIPGAYLRASRSQRLELLRGLMDSDGTIGENGRAEFNNTNLSLCQGVYELVASLGSKVTIKKRLRKLKKHHLDQWRVNWKPTPEANPFNLKRKAEKVLAPLKPTITSRRRVVAVEPVASRPVQCIEVDSPSHLFLAGRQMVPTHNTKCLNFAVAYYIARDPCPILVVQPTIGDAEGYSKDEIAPMVRDMPVLDGRIAPTSKRDGGNTILKKNFPGGVLHMVGADSPRGFRRISVRALFMDETDGWAQTAGEEGDQERLAIRRTETFGNRKIVGGSTPTLDATSRIQKRFLRSDQRYYHVPCPECDRPQVLSWSQFRWRDNDPDTVTYECEHCQHQIPHAQKRWMVEEAHRRQKAGIEGYGWVATKPEIKGHAGFHIWAAYSYAANATWPQLVAEWLESHKDIEARKTFINTVLGETYRGEGDKPDWKRLYDRRENYDIDTVPAGGMLLFAGVDIQKNRIEVEVVAYGRRMESWSVCYRVFPGDTSDIGGEDSPWRELDAMLNETWPHVESGVAMPIRLMGVDSSDQTSIVYQWCSQWPSSRVMALKGRDSYDQVLGSPRQTELTRKGKRSRKGVQLWPVGVSKLKEELYGWLKSESPTVESGAELPWGWCHFPEYGEEYFKQITAEEIVPRIVKGFRRYHWEVTRRNRRNEALDCRVYARAASALLGIDRWDAARWDALAKELGMNTKNQSAKEKGEDSGFSIAGAMKAKAGAKKNPWL